MLLSELEPGQNAIVESVGGSGSIRRHLLDMGLTPNALVTLQKIAPMGDPIQITVRGFELTLRLEEANNVCVTLSDKPATLRKNHHIHQDIAHPGLGELSGAGDYRRHTQRETAKTGPLTFALVGNQNCGKTTLFNQLTGANQHVGNFPGVTVDRKDGTIRSHSEATVTDLPGVYSLSPYSNEEIVTRDFLLESKPDGIINIIDGTNIERNMYLTMQIMELGIPMVLALNMMDEVEKKRWNHSRQRTRSGTRYPGCSHFCCKESRCGRTCRPCSPCCSFLRTAGTNRLLPLKRGRAQPIRSSTSLHPRNCSSHRALRRAGFRAPQIRRNQNGRRR